MFKENDKTKAAVYHLQEFVDHLQDISGVVEEYDYSLMRQTVKQIKVLRNKTVDVEFFSGQTVNIEI